MAATNGGKKCYKEVAPGVFEWGKGVQMVRGTDRCLLLKMLHRFFFFLSLSSSLCDGPKQ
jgi:hypothetical protein